MISRYFIVSFITILMVGCGHKWDNTSAPDIKEPNAMGGVLEFIATNGWNMCTNDTDLSSWEDLKPHYIHNLPWVRYKDRQFQALTFNGILYVLSNSGWHHDYGGVAYNPTTNNFPAVIDGFKPIGGHWYVWCNLEFKRNDLPRIYEK